MTSLNKILVCGDLHFRSEMSYSEYVKDGRKAEKKAILASILDLSAECDGVVLLGDCFNNRNNPSEVIREFVSFVESFGDKEIFIIAGNHEKTGDGKSALDFMREVNKPNWHIITNKIEKIGNLVFLPYFYKTEVGVNTNDKLKNYILKNLPEGDYLFGHHAFVGHTGDYYNEVALPLVKLKDKYKTIFMGHIHTPTHIENLILSGSVFTSEANEGTKFVYTLNLKTGKVKNHELPNRLIFKLDNPKLADIADLPNDSILKLFIKPELLTDEMKSLMIEKKLNLFIINTKESTRAKYKESDNLIDLSVTELLTMYAKQKKIDPAELIEGFLLIK